ncbi:hypothetical protein Tco_0031681 [Tanacetum coccineum]
MAALVPVTPKVEAAAVALPAGVLKLDTHSSSEVDPSKSLLPPISVAPMVSPFLCLDDSESDTEMPERHVSPTPHDVMLARWRSRVTSRSSSPTTSTPEIPTTPIPPAPPAIVAPSTDIISPIEAPPGIRQRRAILIRPVQDIPIGRLYRTHPGGPCRALTARKSVRPLPSYRLTLRYTSHHLDHFTSRSSSDHSSSDHSSSGYSTSDHSSSRHSTSGHFVSGHTPPVTTIADSSTSSRFVYPPPARTLRYNEAYHRWRSASLSTMYPPMTFESSARDSSFESFVEPSRKRCRSPTATVTSYIHASGALAPSCVDLLPPYKRFRDSISPEDNVEEDIDADVLAGIEADATTVVVTTYMDVGAGVNVGIGMEVNVGVDVEDEVEGEGESSDRGTMEVRVDVVDGIDIPDGMLMPDTVERLEQVEEVIQDTYRHVMEIPLQRVEDIEMGQRELEARSLIASGERVGLLDRVVSLERSNTRLRGTLRMASARVDRFRRRMSFMAGEIRQICRFRYYDRMRFRRLETFVARHLELINQRVAEALAAYKANRAAELAVESQNHNRDDDDNGNVRGNGNRNGEGNGDGNGGGNENKNRGDNGNGNPNRNDRGVMPVALFHISNCPERYQVKYATCTLLNSALTWWNAHIRTIGVDVVFAMSWRELMKLMTEVYCPRNEIQKMESEL